MCPAQAKFVQGRTSPLEPNRAGIGRSVFVAVFRKALGASLCLASALYDQARGPGLVRVQTGTEVFRCSDPLVPLL